jgi:hypothetical protein
MSAKHTFMAWDFQTESAGLKLAMLQIANNSNDDGVSWYGIEKMAESCGMGVRTFQRHINELEKIGVLEITRRPNRTSVYRLVWRACQNGTSDDSGTAKMTPRNCQNDTSSGAKLAHDLNKELKKEPNSIFVDELFEKFWDAYPLKVGKQEAISAFKKVMKGKSENNCRMTMNMILSFHFARIESGVFGVDKLHASTLLNKKRWDDDPEFVKNFKLEWEQTYGQ